MLRLLPVCLALVVTGCMASTPADNAAETDEADVPGESTEQVGCPDGQHACDTSCAADRVNQPAHGCALGCGEACPVPENGAATCTADGVCDYTCDEGARKTNGRCVFDICGEQHVRCGSAYDADNVAYECGTCAEGVTCGASHECVVERDAHEPNDSLPQAVDLGMFDDADDGTMTVTALTIDSATDKDYFTFRLVDGFDGGNPDAKISIRNGDADFGWLDENHEITAWFKCDTEDAGSSVSCGEWGTTDTTNSLTDPALGVGCKTVGAYVVWAHISASCTGTTDSGTVTFVVSKSWAPMGDKYSAKIVIDPSILW